MILFSITGAIMGSGRWDANEKKRIEYEKIISKAEMKN
jgi:hypothetical protein